VTSTDFAMVSLYQVHDYWWIWLAAQLIVVTIDMSFMLLRPHSMPDGHWLISPIFIGWHKVRNVEGGGVSKKIVLLFSLLKRFHHC
jgi:hypothetical protein